MILENKFLKLEVKSLGAEMTHLLLKDSNREMLFQPDPLIWQRQAPHLFPIVGRLINNEYTYKNKTYSMAQHGFLRDSMMELVKSSETKLSYVLSSNQQTRINYPFDFKVWIEYKLLKKGVKIKYTVENFGDEIMYFSIGAHPGFNIDMNEGAIVRLIAKKNRRIKRYNTENGKIKDRKIFESLTMKVNKQVDLNATYIFDNVKKVSLNASDVTVDVKCDEMKYVALWSPIDQRTSQIADVICIEPWQGIADTVDSDQMLHHKLGILSLKPKQKKSFQFSIEFKVKKDPLTNDVDDEEIK